MNKQINSINGYSCVQVPIKVQFYDFSVKKFQNVVKARVTCLHMHFIPPPHPNILYETQRNHVVHRLCTKKLSHLTVSINYDFKLAYNPLLLT